jgi:hypothetical protein
MVTVTAERRFKNNPVQFEVTRIQLLNDVKGRLISGVTLSIARDELKPAVTDLLKEQFNSPNTDAAKGILNLRIYDPDANRWLRMTSSRRIPLDRKLVNILDSLPVEYKFETV